MPTIQAIYAELRKNEFSIAFSIGHTLDLAAS